MKKILLSILISLFLCGQVLADGNIMGKSGSSEKLSKTARQSLVFASGDTVKSFVVNANAMTHTIVLEMPSFSGAVVTGTLSVENSDGNEIYTNGGMVENDTHVMFAERPIVSGNTIKVTLSDDPSSNGTAYVSMYLKGE